MLLCRQPTRGIPSPQRWNRHADDHCHSNVSHGLSILATVQQCSVQDLAGTDTFLVDGVGLPVAKLALIEGLEDLNA